MRRGRRVGWVLGFLLVLKDGVGEDDVEVLGLYVGVR